MLDLQLDVDVSKPTPGLQENVQEVFYNRMPVFQAALRIPSVSPVNFLSNTYAKTRPQALTSIIVVQSDL